MFNPVLLNQINEVERAHREHQIEEIQLINQALPQQHVVNNPLKIAMNFISRFSSRLHGQWFPRKTSGAIELSED